MQSFGWNLLQFARSVDHMTDDIANGMKELTGDYFMRKSGLDACYFCVHRADAVFEGRSALRTIWSSDRNTRAQVVRRFDDGGGASPSLRALAYNEGRSLWVTNEATIEDDGKAVTLDAADPVLVDHWRERKGDATEVLPPYISMHDRPCRTLIALPLVENGSKLGVLIVEFDRRIPMTVGARREAEHVAEALARILWLHDAALAQQDGTRRAFEELKDIVENNSSTVDPPTVFFAFPQRTDARVIEVIRTTVRDEYGHQVRLVAWDELSSAGQITDHVIAQISRCDFGICYLSEHAEEDLKTDDEAADDEARYRDNYNVMIEAGMLQALRQSRFAPTAAWIPIREHDSLTGPIPFDFAVERKITVPRGQSGDLDDEELRAMLRKRIEDIIHR